MSNINPNTIVALAGLDIVRLESLFGRIRDRGLAVTPVATVSDAFASLSTEATGLVLIDSSGQAAADIERLMRSARSQLIPVVIVSDTDADDGGLSLTNHDELLVHVKAPVDFGSLETIIMLNMKAGHLERENSQLTNERDEMTRMLTDEQRYAENIIDCSTDIIISVDLNRCIFQFNRRAQELFGYTKDEVLGKPVDMLYAYLDQSQCVYQNTIKNKRYTAEVINRKKNGELFPVLISASILLEKGGKPIGTMGIARDITEWKRIELSLKKAKDQAEAANRSKSEFLTNMSHELRTPMTSVIGYAELIEDVLPPDSEHSGYVDNIRRNGQHLLRLINEILDLSRIESGKLVLNKEICYPSELIDDVVHILSSKIMEKNLTVDVEFGKRIPYKIKSDPTRIVQCLVNLIGNAIKFTPESGRIVTRLTYDEQPNPPILCFQVEDNGIGIPDDQIERIMEPFERVEGASSEKHEGTGLGLSITKRLAGMLGGSLAVESEEGKGSTFYLTVSCGVDRQAVQLMERSQIASLSRPRTRTKKSAGVANRKILKGRILLAEDNLDIQKLITKFLTDAGAEVDIASDGETAFEIAMTQDFKLVLLDMRLPRMNGLTVVRKLREEGSIVPVIALTASAMPDDIERFKNAGCDDCAVKPISRYDLIRLAHSWMRTGTTIFDPSRLAEQSDYGQLEIVRALADDTRPIFSAYHDDPDMREILIGYVNTLPDKFNRLTAAWKNSDMPVFLNIAHGLHGSGGGFGFGMISDHAERLENLVRRQADVKRMQSELKELRQVISRILKAYQ